MIGHSFVQIMLNGIVVIQNSHNNKEIIVSHIRGFLQKSVIVWKVVSDFERLVKNSLCFIILGELVSKQRIK